jgi:PEGA domain
MKNKTALRFISILLSITVLFSSCVSTTLIQSYPSGAKLSIDGVEVGKTPYWYADTKIMGSETDITLESEGYEPIYSSFLRAERVDLGAVIAGCFFWFPFLWTLKYQPFHHYELLPKQSTEQIVPNLTPQKIEEPQLPTKKDSVSTKEQKLKELNQLLEQKLINNRDYERQKRIILNEK